MSTTAPPTTATRESAARPPRAGSSRRRPESPRADVASLLEQLLDAIPEFVDQPLPKARKITRAHAVQVRHDNHVVATLKTLLERAEDERRRHRAPIRHLLADRAPIFVGGLELVRRVQSSGPSFRIAQFLKRYKLTKAMQPFYSEGTEYDIFVVKELDK
jgi:hypothetical protein